MVLRCLLQSGSRLLLLARRGFSAESNLKKVALYDFHIEHGAKMVPFAGFSMPLSYPDQSLIESHLHTRHSASLFDVSHMLQTKLYGKDRVKFIEKLVPSDVNNLKSGQALLTVFTNDLAGIKDDLIVTKCADHLHIVTNAGCIEKDVQHLQEKAKLLKLDVHIEHVDQQAQCLLALQGPGASRILGSEQNCSAKVDQLYFMSSVECKIFGIADCRLTRCGYTGEDGFEISVDSRHARQLCEQLLRFDKLAGAGAKVRLCGLGARDTLRLEAGLCLYGSDIDESTTPVEANLAWIIGKRRRESGDFPGAEVMLKQLGDKRLVERRRIGLVGETGRPARTGCKLENADGQEVGVVTSGCPSPCLRKNVAMAYCKAQYAAVGTKLKAQISQTTRVDVTVTKMPFVPAKYFHEPK